MLDTNADQAKKELNVTLRDWHVQSFNSKSVVLKAYVAGGEYIVNGRTVDIIIANKINGRIVKLYRVIGWEGDDFDDPDAKGKMQELWADDTGIALSDVVGNDSLLLNEIENTIKNNA